MNELEIPNNMNIILTENLPGSQIETCLQSTPATFLEIAGISHDENSWSDIYAYFLSKKGVGQIFLNSLLRVISLKTNKKIIIEDFRVDREVKTNKGNRIDLLIKSKSHSIIIENKVRHYLNNDLEDYWVSVNGKDSKKTGVVLSLYHMPTNHSDYINVTHKEWISEIREQMNDKLSNLNAKDKSIINDFYQTIMKESKCLDLKKSKYYLENRAEINSLVNVASETKRWLMHIFSQSIKCLNDFSLVHDDRDGSKYRYVMCKLPETDELVITIFYEFLWNSKPGEARLLFLIEPLGKWLKNAEIMEEIIVNIVAEEGLGCNYSHTKHFWHCGGIECTFSDDQILDENFIKNCIADHLVNPDSKLMKAALRIKQLLSTTHIPSYSWDDAMNHLREQQAKIGGDDFANWMVDAFKFILYDRKNQIVVLEVPDKGTKARMENYLVYDDVMSALKYAFGENVRCSLICPNLDTNK